MRFSVKAHHLPQRIATGAFILNSGIGKLRADEETAAQLHGFAADAYPVLARLKPAFSPDGTITAGTASQISDGAAAVVVTSAEFAERAGLNVIAEIGAHGNVAGPDNSLMVTGSS